MSGSQDQRPLIGLIEGLSKKYCRKLQRSLWYGLNDLARELLGGSPTRDLRREEFYALRDVSFEIRRGDCIGLLGPNGAGKTTLMKLMNGLLKPTSGRIRLRGRVAALTQLGAGFNQVLTGRENLYINAAVLGFSKQEADEIFEDIVEFSELGDAIEDPVKTYSSGMRARLGFSIAAFVRPDVLLMDEVLATGDRGFKLKCFEHIGNLRDQGTSIVIVSHAVGPLTRICDRAVVLDQGQMVLNDDIKAGVEKYEELLRISKINDAMPDEDDDLVDEIPRQAATPLCIDSIQLLDELGEPIDKAKHDRDTRLRIRIVKLQAGTLDLTPRMLAVVHGETQVVCTMLSDQGLIDLDQDECTIELQLPRLKLNQGVYFTDIRIVNRMASDVIDERRFVLTVSSGKRQGLTQLEHAWERVSGELLSQSDRR